MRLTGRRTVGFPAASSLWGAGLRLGGTGMATAAVSATLLPPHHSRRPRRRFSATNHSHRVVSRRQAATRHPQPLEQPEIGAGAGPRLLSRRRRTGDRPPGTSPRLPAALGVRSLGFRSRSARTSSRTTSFHLVLSLLPTLSTPPRCFLPASRPVGRGTRCVWGCTRYPRQP